MGADNPNVLDDSVKTVRLQFSFSNQSIVPRRLRQMEPETPKDRACRKGEGQDLLAGIMFIDKFENVSLLEFVAQLEAAGYRLVDACYQRRVKDDGSRYPMVRYMFAKPDQETGPNHWLKQPDVRGPLRQMCEQAMWRVRGYLNRFFENGKEVPGAYAMSLNFEARKPLAEPSGKPVCVWQKDAEGNRVGSEPLPIKPSFVLSIQENAVLLK